MRAPESGRCAVLNCGFLPRAAFRACVLVSLLMCCSAAVDAKRRHAAREGTRARIVDPAPAVTATPNLQAIIADMQRPLPPLEEPAGKQQAAPALVSPEPVPEPVRRPVSWETTAYIFMVCATIAYLGWFLRPARRHAAAGGGFQVSAIPRIPTVIARVRLPRNTLKAIQMPRPFQLLPAPRKSAPPTVQHAHLAAVPKPMAKASAPKASSKPVSKPSQSEALSLQQIAQLKAQSTFPSWRELLVAARFGNPLARQILRSNPRHSALEFSLEAQDFKLHLHLARNLEFSEVWMHQILTLLRLTECFDERVDITSPLGHRHQIHIDDPISSLNTVLGYENLPDDIRAQLELRRWILWNTRIDGSEQPEILAAFPLRPAAA